MKAAAAASLRELRRALGSDAVVEGDETLARYGRDFSGHGLGRPLAAALPRSTEEVRAIVAWARRRRTALTPVGAQTSFWASTPVEGRLVVDLRLMDRMLGVDRVNLTVRAEAGASVAALDAILGAERLFLPVCPDGFGDATLGSLVANHTSAGHGMFDGSIDEHLVSVTAVLGTGEALRTGASSVLAGLPSFTRAGLPDLTGLLLGSEGTLGIVTELTLRVRPVPLLRRLSIQAPFRASALSAAAQDLRVGGLCHGLRHDAFARAPREEAFLEVAAYAGPEDLEQRLARVREILARRGLTAAAAPDQPRWGVRPPSSGWKGISLAIPYSHVEAARRLWEESLRARVAGAASPEGFLRVYYGSAGAAVLVGWSHLPDEGGQQERLACEIRALLLRFGVPYRIGTVWRTLAAGRLDPVYRSLLGEVKRLCDPDDVLNPGVSVSSLPRPRPARRAPRRRAR